MLACNQNGVMGSLIHEESDLEIWRVFEKKYNKHGWIGVFNRSENNSEIVLKKEQLGFLWDNYSLFDIWNERKIDFGTVINLKPNGVLFIKFEEF
tara:strand:+ start:118 stop:402 length:285 start_codon:yes stop_codon:yes gene_type:complete